MEGEDIAVVGIGCNFPGGEGLENFWRVLLEGTSCVCDIPDERFNNTFWRCPPGAILEPYKNRAALINGFNEFDHKFFGISEAESSCMDPQHKLLLQCTYRALEDAGITMETISGSRTGVYIGLMNRDYETLVNNSPASISHYHATGAAMSVAANRISFTFNLTGPSLAIDSACSSSLVALHLACQAIKQGDCSMAVCGGVSCILEPGVFVALSKARMISPEGTSRPFSKTANGYGRGEGCGILLLKPLKHALRDYNKVWGVLSKTAVSQDGRSVTPITKPSMAQQEKLLQRIYSETDRVNVQYIEAHGTGTPVGDPVEAQSISNVISKTRPVGSETLHVGSLKGNIGHTESAAGVAGLIKVLLMMKHETIVPSLFYSEESSSIDAKALRLHVPTKAMQWETNGSLERLAGINSFGFGGTNAHVIVREFLQTPHSGVEPFGSHRLFVFSAASEKSLMMCLMDTSQRVSRDATTDIQALSYTSACRRSHYKHRYRKAMLASSFTDLKAQMTSALSQKYELTKTDVHLVFVFCGNGVCYRGMCEHLLREVPVFRHKVREIENIFQSYGVTSLSGSDDISDYCKPDAVQPRLFAIQVGIACTLNHWGVKPDVVLGHSVGEVAAAHCAGLLSLEDAVKVIYHRSVLQSKVTGGKMLVVGNIAVAQVLKVLDVFPEKISVASFNSPQSCTLSGDAHAVDLLHRVLEDTFIDANLFLHVLHVSAAYHSRMMDPILGDVERNISNLAVKDPHCELFSTVTGHTCSDGDFSTGSYWAKNIRESVLFEQTLRAVKNHMKLKRNVVFVEVGPRRSLQRNIQETLGKDTVVLPSVQPERDYETMLSTVAKLFETGIHVDWQTFYSGNETLPTASPIYQFDNVKKELRFEAVTTVFSQHPLTSQTAQDEKEHTFILSFENAAYLWEHTNKGVVVVPGALYVELAYASIMASLKPKMPLSLLQLSVTFHKLFTLNSNSNEVRVILEHAERGSSFEVQSSTAIHAHGTWQCTNGQVEEPSLSLDIILQRCNVVIKRKEIYSILSQVNFEYGSVFKQLDNVRFGCEFKEAVTIIEVPGEILKHLHEYCLHPVVLDYFMQMTAVVAVGGNPTRQGFPSAIGCVALLGPLQQEMVLYLRATCETPEYLEVCGCFSTKQGSVLVELKDVRIVLLGGYTNVSQSLFFHNESVSTLHEIDLKSKIKAIILEDHFGISQALRPYVHPDSIMIMNRDHWSTDELRDVMLLSLDADIDDIVFMWGMRDLSHLSPENMLECLVGCCEQFRQLVLLLKESKRSFTVHVITYRSAEKTVEHLSPGFVLSGMTRACAAELTGISFQLVDVASVKDQDIQMLVHVINNCKHHEVTVGQGQAMLTRIVRTPMKDVALGETHSICKNDFILQTDDPYKMSTLSAKPCDAERMFVEEQSVEIQLLKVCVHSSDYFPVSASQLNYGEAIYWNKHTTQRHTLIALDFSGIVTAVGKDVHSLKVGDHIASCYPVAATAKVVIPEAACYSTDRLPFLRETPCVSYLVLAWEIMQRILPQVKEQKKLAIISSSQCSGLVNVLALTANRLGWNVIARPRLSKNMQHIEQCDTVVFLPPFDQAWPEVNDLVGHIILVCSNKPSSLFSANMILWNNEFTCVNELNVSSVFQRGNLKTHNRKISHWLLSLGLDTALLPLKSNTFQLLGANEGQVIAEVESYFTASAVQQIVLDVDEADCPVSDICLLATPRQLFRLSCIYIVTGGLSGLGLETVKFIAHNGGRCIATLSRRSVSEDIQFEMDKLRKILGVEITHLQCDVSVSTQVVAAISDLQQRFPSCPIKGVFHSAAELHDGLIESLNESLFRRVFQPKVAGVLNLHYATLHSQLDYFVCYSSISSLIGNASQCNYAAANSFLDTFCHYRRQRGLVGQSINWGPLNLGLLLNKDHFQRFLEGKGMMVLGVREVHEALKKCVLMNRPQQVICKFHFRNLRHHVLSQNAFLRERLSALVEAEVAADEHAAARVPHVSSTHDNMLQLLSDISSIATADIHNHTPLWSLGIDSLLAMTLQNQVFQETGVNIPLVRLLDPTSTLTTLVTIITDS